MRLEKKALPGEVDDLIDDPAEFFVVRDRGQGLDGYTGFHGWCSSFMLLGCVRSAGAEKKDPWPGSPRMQKHITSFLLPYAGIDRIR